MKKIVAGLAVMFAAFCLLGSLANLSRNVSTDTIIVEFAVAVIAGGIAWLLVAWAWRKPAQGSGSQLGR